jgi:hypothetical protein
MRPDNREKASRFLLSLICFTAYISLFIALIANAFNTDPYHFILS